MVGLLDPLKEPRGACPCTEPDVLILIPLLGAGFGRLWIDLCGCGVCMSSLNPSQGWDITEGERRLL